MSSKSFKPKVPRSQMEALTSLLEYCKQTNCERHAEFLIGMVSLRQVKNQSSRDQLLLNLYEKYLSGRAKSKDLIDLPFELTKKVRKHIEHGKKPIDYDIFDDVFQFVVNEIETVYLAKNPELFDLLSRKASI